MSSATQRLGFPLLILCAIGFGAHAHADVLSYRHGLPAQLRQEVPNPGTALAQLKATTTRPAGLAAAPDLPKGTQYLTVPLGEGPQEFLAAFDPQANRRRGALYFDTDGDGDLAEEEPLSPDGRAGSSTFGPIAVKLKREGFTGLYHFCIQRYPSSRADYWRLQPACYNVGQVTIGDKAYRMAVIDGAGNGLFNDLWSLPTGWPDHAYVDWDGDGKFGTNESLNCTRRYLRDGRWYGVSMSADGSEVSFAPTEFPMGTVTLGNFGLSAQFVSSTGQGGFTATGRERIEVPADDYRIFRCWLNQEADDGTTWSANGSRAPGAAVSVREGQEAALVIGQPFKASLVAGGKSPYRPGQTIPFQAKLSGADGKDYQFRRGNKQMPAPKMVIRDEAGKELGSYAFQYG